jgi:hypothetical protein
VPWPRVLFRGGARWFGRGELRLLWCGVPAAGRRGVRFGPTTCACETFDEQGNVYFARCTAGECSCEYNRVVGTETPFDADSCFPFDAESCEWTFSALAACGFPGGTVNVCDL